MRRALWMIGLVLAGCAGPAASPAGADQPLACEDLHDCAEGQICVCRGVGIDPCMPPMSDLECNEARCGGRICADPDDLPPPPP